MFENLIRTRTPASVDVGVGRRDNVRIAVVHFGEEAPVADIVVLAAPQLVFGVVRSVNRMSVESDSDNLVAFENVIVAPCQTQELFGLFAASAVLQARFFPWLKAGAC